MHRFQHHSRALSQSLRWYWGPDSRTPRIYMNIIEQRAILLLRWGYCMHGLARAAHGVPLMDSPGTASQSMVCLAVHGDGLSTVSSATLKDSRYPQYFRQVRISLSKIIPPVSSHLRPYGPSPRQNVSILFAFDRIALSFQGSEMLSTTSQ
jgi:hypothetical protein